MRLRIMICFILVLYGSGRVWGQFWEKLSNPQVSVEIKYPPMTGLMLNRAAIGKVSGNCGEELADKLSSVLSAKMEVLDRANLDVILREQRFGISEFVDASTAASLGKILGPTALIFVRANCRDLQQPLRQTVGSGKDRRLVLISRTTVTLRGSVQIVDLQTARVFQQMPLEIVKTSENRSEEGQPEFPLAEEVLSSAMLEAVSNASKLLVPWSEYEKVYFYDDKECEMKAAFEALRIGQLEKVLELARRSVESCEQGKFKNEKDQAKNVGKAHYNLGVALMLNHKYDEASAAFDRTVQLRGAGDIVRQAIARNLQLKSASESMRRTVERTERFEESRVAGSSPANAWSSPAPGTASQSPGTSSAVQPANQQASPAERLRNLDKLFKEGLITKEEFEKKRTAILAEM